MTPLNPLGKVLPQKPQNFAEVVFALQNQRKIKVYAYHRRYQSLLAQASLSMCHIITKSISTKEFSCGLNSFQRLLENHPVCHVP